MINVSSPNTPGLRDLQGEAQLRAILRAVAAQCRIRPPVLVKIAPDIGDAKRSPALVETCVAEGVQGLIVVNTTISRGRPVCARRMPREAGGLSGAPLFRLSTAVLARAFLLARGRLVLIGVGGVSTGERGADQNPRRCVAGAALHRVRLRRTGADPAAEARTGRRAARRRFRPRAGRGGQRRANVWQNSG